MDDRTVDLIFSGSLESLPPVSSKIVRIFTSSTFTGRYSVTFRSCLYLLGNRDLNQARSQCPVSYIKIQGSVLRKQFSLSFFHVDHLCKFLFSFLIRDVIGLFFNSRTTHSTIKNILLQWVRHRFFSSFVLEIYGLRHSL